MKHITAYLAYAAIYGTLLLSAGLATDQASPEALATATAWAAPFAAAPIALLAAMRLGRPSRAGIAITSVALAALTCIATVGIYIAIAIPVVGRPTLSFVADAFRVYFTLGSWRLLLSFTLFVAAPLAWAAPLMNRRNPLMSAA